MYECKECHVERGSLVVNILSLFYVCKVLLQVDHILRRIYIDAEFFLVDERVHLLFNRGCMICT